MSRRPDTRAGQDVVSAVAASVRRSGLLPAGSRVAAAVSGGADSVALYRILLALEATLGIQAAGLIHVNHQLRGAASDADEQFCRDLAGATERPAHVERVQVGRGSGAGRRSPEEAARTVRYEALERGRRVLGADLVALGHTRDDQAETVLLRLLRGAGPDGLAGIPPQRGRFVRPLLETGRADLRRFLDRSGVPWVEDASNTDLTIPRNMLRNKVLPELEARVPHAGMTLARHALIARDEADWLLGLVNVAVDRFVHLDEAATTVRGGLCEVPVALQRRVVLAALRHAGVRHPGFEEVEAVRRLAGEARGGLALRGGVLANRIGGDVVLTDRGPGHHAGAPAYRYTLRVPGTVPVPEASAIMAAVAEGHARPPEGNAVEVEVDGSALGRSIAVRNWRTGDLIRPVGLGGRKKLQDVFVDRKVPRAVRGLLPLVVDDEDRVLWVPGLALDERLRVTVGTKAVVVLRLTQAKAQPVGGPE